MKLKNWLLNSGTKRDAFAEMVKVAPQTVSRWCNGSMPVSSKLILINQITKGQVTANDFYNQGAEK